MARIVPGKINPRTGDLRHRYGFEKKMERSGRLI
jgi:hypothetical protein